MGTYYHLPLNSVPSISLNPNTAVMLQLQRLTNCSIIYIQLFSEIGDMDFRVYYDQA